MRITQIAYGMLLLLPLAGCSQPPPPVAPANATEQKVLALAAKRVPSDWTVPVEIIQDPPGTFLVTYWTPAKEIELLGLRQAIIKPADQAVEFVPRD